MLKVVNKIRLLVFISAFACTLFSCRTSVEDSGLEYKPELDSLINIWNNNNRTGRHDSTVVQARAVLKDALSAGDTVTALYAGIFTAQSCLFMDDKIDSAKYYADMVERYIRTSGEPSLLVNLDNIMGTYYLKTELNYSKSLEYYLEGLEQAERHDMTQARIAMLANIVTIFYLRRDERGIEYARQAYEVGLSSEGVSDYTKCISLIPMAQMLCLCQETEEAWDYISEAKMLAYKTQASTTYTVIHSVYAFIYSARGDFDAAETEYKEALKYIDYTDPGTAILVFLQYGNMLQKQKRLEEAARLFVHALDFSSKSKNMEFRQELLYRAAAIFYRTGRLDTAFRYSFQYMTYSDSIVQNKERDLNEYILHNSQIEHEKEILAGKVKQQKLNRQYMNMVFISIILFIFACFMMILNRKKTEMYRALVAQHLAVRSSNTASPSAPSSSGKSHSRKDIWLKSEALMKNEKVYRQKDLTQEKFASMVGTNRTYLSQAINEYAGMPFNSWVNMYRISEATEILSDPDNDISLKQLADDLGYNSVSVFHKVFQKGTGLTPNTWRKTKAAHK